jgi:hypothetical protein
MSDPPLNPKFKVSFMPRFKIRKYTLHNDEKKGTHKGSQTFRYFERVIVPQIIQLHKNGEYGDIPLTKIIKEKKKEFIQYRTQTRRKERILSTDKDANVAHFMGRLIAYLNDNNIKINNVSLNEIFNRIEAENKDPYLCIQCKKAVLKYFVGRKKNGSNTLLEPPLTISEHAALIERSQICPEHHLFANKIESAAATNTRNKPANKPANKSANKE